MSEKNASCPHVRAHQLPEGVYAAPIGKCRCCGFSFMYIGMGSWSSGGDTEFDSPDPTLCIPCGGKSYRERRVKGKVVEHQQGSHA